MAVFCAASITISDKAATSVDGITWTARTLPATGEWRSIAWNGSVFCALSFGSNQAATSPDGITWTARTLPSSASWQSIVWNGSIFCAVAQASNKAATSTDGITWTARTLPSSADWFKVSWNGSVFCAISWNSDKAATSPDGITWTARTLPSIGEWRGLAWNGSVFCATCNSNIAATSPDGITWTARTLPASAIWRGIVWNGSIFCTVASGTDQAATSTDGIAWTARTLPVSAGWRDLSWNGSVFCAVASGTDQAATSTDGITWTARTLPSSADWYSIAYQNPPFSGNPVIRQITFTGLTPAAIYTGFINPPFICQVNFTGLAPSASLLSIIKYTGSPVALSLSLLGLQSTAPMGVFIGNPVQGFIDFNGLTPSVLSTGFADSPEEKTYIDWIGNLGALVTRNVNDPPPNWTTVRYRCFLTPPDSTVFDIELPISSFQSRLRLNNLSYLSVVLKGADAYADQIIEAANRKMCIFREYHYLDGTINSTLIAAADYETLQINEGGKSGVTATLSGNGDFVPSNFATITLKNPIYRNESSGSKRYRCEIDARLRPGDTAQINGDSFVVNEIVYVIDTKTSIMEISG